jgi:Raf kinase inhibitor-like YbhB/YbcL family protein
LDRASAKPKSQVLIVDDSDAPDPDKLKMTWVHWLLYNIPPTVTELPKAIAASNLPSGILQGKNDWKRIGYRGPCPPIGRHRYFHKLYALDIELPDLHQPEFLSCSTGWSWAVPARLRPLESRRRKRPQFRMARALPPLKTPNPYSHATRARITSQPSSLSRSRRHPARRVAQG